MKEFMRKFYGLLCSTKLSLVILFILVFFMFLGTLFSQVGTYDEYVEAFGLKTYLRLFPLGVFDIFHSWYFITAAIILYINVFLCTLRGYIVERKSFSSIKEKHKGAQETKSEDDFSYIGKVLKKRGYRYKTICEDEKNVVLLGIRGMRKRFVSIYYHFFLALTIVGFVLSAMTRFDGSVYFEIGDKKFVPKASKEMGIFKRFKRFDPEKVDSIEVELKDYKMEYLWYKDDYYPRDYKSTLTVRYRGKEKTMTIEVNRPLKFKRLTLFQMDYSQKFDVEVEDTIFHLSSGDAFYVNDIEGAFKVRTVYVGELFNEKESYEIVPNAKIYFREEKDKKWVVVGKFVLDDTVLIKGKKMILRNVKEVSGIYYKRDDGVPVLYISFLFFMVGLFLRVFFPTYEIKLFYDKKIKSISLKGTASGIAAYIEKEKEEIEKMLDQEKIKN